MTETDDTLTVEDARHEVDMLRYKHGTLGACKVFLQRHTDRMQWVRAALFVTALYALYTGLQSVPLIGPYGLTVATLGPVEAAVWTLFAACMMWATYRGLDYALS